MREKLIKQIEQNIQTIYLAVKTSTRQYIFLNEMKSSIKQILQTLIDRYK
jgi:hypothetical protein